jgi:FkbM family methyltransferase
MRLLLAWRNSWKTAAIARILQTRPGMFIDVGANAGQSLVDFLLAPVRGSYLGFEPNIACHAHLADMMRLNRLEHSWIVPAGLSDRPGIGPLYLFGGESDPGASMLRDLRPALKARPVTSAFYRFDDLDDFRDRDIALVEIDVEGGELEVLRGMEQTITERHPWIICEVLDRDSAADADRHSARLADLDEWLCSADYLVYRIVRTSDDINIRGIEAVPRFASKQWDESSATACDYLFVPSSEPDSAISLFGVATQLSSCTKSPF